MRSRARLPRGDRGIASGEHQIVRAVQDEARTAALCRKTPEAQVLLLAERESVIRRRLPEAHDKDSAHPCDGCADASVGKLTKETGTKSSAPCGVGPFLAPNTKSLASIGATSTRSELWDLWSRSRAAARYILGNFAARFSTGSVSRSKRLLAASEPSGPRLPRQ
jgi:hypothetical protein